MVMRRSSFSFLLLLMVLLCNGAKGSGTLELPRKIDQESASSMEEIDVAGQKRFRVLTDRYLITAFQPEEGSRAGERLEHLFNVWQLLFAEFIEEPKNERGPRPLRVIVYRDKEEYIANLLRIEPAIAQTNGFYFAPRRTAYFYSPETKVLFHEGTHQILAEHFFGERMPRFRNNFWVIEGMALFMETLEIEGNCYKIGNILNDRLFAAKEYQFNRNFNMPIQKLTAMNANDIQTSREILKIYSQSAALVHWLMFAEEGRYRKPLFELLHRTYLDTAKPETLSELTGLSYEELDNQYVEFLKTIPDE
jgi:hypothetical protein